jgi:hypothetical protein
MPIFLTADHGDFGFSYNLCSNCLKTTSRVNSLVNQGRSIYDANIDLPKNCYIHLLSLLNDPQRETIQIERGKLAQLQIKQAMKRRRNLERQRRVKILASQYDIGIGQYLSWGFGDLFDEYFGEINPLTQQPHGYGIRFYSDGSIYIGYWENGQRHSITEKSLWTRPDGFHYEGNWMNDIKHGYGISRYPNHSSYEGEFAKGYEHGKGVMMTADNQRYEGKFRFGKKDGPGILYSSDGLVLEKRIFKEAIPLFTELPLMIINEESEQIVEDPHRPFLHPSSLLTIAIRAVAQAMIHHRHLISSQSIQKKLQSILKPRISQLMLECMYPKGSLALIQALPPYAFHLQSEQPIQLNYCRFQHLDCESMIYCLQANYALQQLELINNKLDPTSIELICDTMIRQSWPHLRYLDISFNKVDMSILQTLLMSVSSLTSFTVLKMNGCNITSVGAKVIGQYLENNSTLQELSLGFNFLQALGIEPIAAVSDPYMCILYTIFIYIVITIFYYYLGINEKYNINYSKCTS